MSFADQAKAERKTAVELAELKRQQEEIEKRVEQNHLRTLLEKEASDFVTEIIPQIKELILRSARRSGNAYEFVPRNAINDLYISKTDKHEQSEEDAGPGWTELEDAVARKVAEWAWQEGFKVEFKTLQQWRSERSLSAGFQFIWADGTPGYGMEPPLEHLVIKW